MFVSVRSGDRPRQNQRARVAGSLVEAEVVLRRDPVGVVSDQPRVQAGLFQKWMDKANKRRQLSDPLLNDIK